MSFITNWRAKASSHLYSLFSQLFSCCVCFYMNIKEVPISACTSYYSRTEVAEEAAQDFSTCSQGKHHQKQSAALQLKLQWQIRSFSRNRNSPRAAYSIKSCFISLRLYMSLLESHAVLDFLQKERRKLHLLLHWGFKDPIKEAEFCFDTMALLLKMGRWRSALRVTRAESSGSQRWTCTM